MRRWWLYVLWLNFGIWCYAQEGNFNLGARNSGLGGASLTIGDEYSLFNNIGGIGRIEHHALFGGYQKRYGISAFQVIGGGAVYHHNLGNAGLGYYKFGDDLFSQQRIHLAIGNKIQMVSLGLGTDVIQYHIASIGTQQVVAIQFGAIAEISKNFLFGAHIFNINQATLISETGERLPTVMKGGASYRPTEELMLNVEVEKNLDFHEIFKAGIEYQVVERIFVRTGIRTKPFVGSFGFGFHPKKMKLDYAFGSDSTLGNIHEFSLAYTFKQ